MWQVNEIRCSCLGVKTDPKPPETDRWIYLKTLHRNNDVAKLFVETITKILNYGNRIKYK